MQHIEDIKFAKELPQKRQRIQELESLKASLEDSKDKVSKEAYENLSKKYDKELHQLKAWVEEKETQLNEIIKQLKTSIEQNKEEIKAWQKELEEHTLLYNQKAIDKNAYQQKKKDLNKKIAANQKQIKKLTNTLQESGFYKTYTGNQTYFQYRTEKYKDKGKQTLDNVGESTGKVTGFFGNLSSKINLRKVLIYGIPIILIALIAIFFGRITDEIAWLKAKSDDTYEAYTTYMSDHDEHYMDAKKLGEEKFWISIKPGCETPSDVDKYLDNYSNGIYLEDALALKEELLWDSVNKINHLEAYKIYLKKYPKGDYYSDAEDSISVMQSLIGIASSEMNLEQPIKILYPNWSEAIAFTFLAKVVLEKQGYEVNIITLEPGPIYTSLAKGDAELFFDAWLPHTHEDYWEYYGEDLVKIGESFSDGTTGLVVPQYVDMNSIEELNEHVDKFDGEIIGIGSGADIHRNTEKAIEAYNLDFKQITSSGTAMEEALEKAYHKKDPIVITGWKPGLIWANYDLKYLDDPKDIYPKEVCAIISRENFQKDYPVASNFCKNFNLNEEQLYDLIGRIQEGDNKQKATEHFYNENKSMINSWFSAQNKER